MQPGDLVLCRQNTVLDKIISVAQMLHTSSQASHWTHVAVVKDPKTGEMYEAVSSGVKIGNISAYPDHLVVPMNLNASSSVISTSLAIASSMTLWCASNG